VTRTCALPYCVAIASPVVVPDEPEPDEPDPLPDEEVVLVALLDADAEAEADAVAGAAAVGRVAAWGWRRGRRPCRRSSRR